MPCQCLLGLSALRASGLRRACTETYHLGSQLFIQGPEVSVKQEWGTATAVWMAVRGQVPVDVPASKCVVVRWGHICFRSLYFSILISVHMLYVCVCVWCVYCVVCVYSACVLCSVCGEYVWCMWYLVCVGIGVGGVFCVMYVVFVVCVWVYVCCMRYVWYVGEYTIVHMVCMCMVWGVEGSICGVCEMCVWYGICGVCTCVLWHA